MFNSREKKEDQRVKDFLAKLSPTTIAECKKSDISLLVDALVAKIPENEKGIIEAFDKQIIEFNTNPKYEYWAPERHPSLNKTQYQERIQAIYDALADIKKNGTYSKSEGTNLTKYGELQKSKGAVRTPLMIEKLLSLASLKPSLAP